MKKIEAIYKKYQYSNGHTLELTEEEFDRIVETIRMLRSFEKRRLSRSKAEKISMNISSNTKNVRSKTMK